jgi:hypothetical protein
MWLLLLLLLIRMLACLMCLQNALFGQCESTPGLCLSLRRYRRRHVRRRRRRKALCTISCKSRSPGACMVRMCIRVAITKHLTSSHRLEYSHHIRIEVRDQVMWLSMSMRIDGRMRYGVRRQGIRIISIGMMRINLEVIRVGDRQSWAMMGI